MRSHTVRHATSLTVSLTLLATALVGTLSITPTTAQATGGLIINQEGHVDSPKIFWESNNFTLKAKGDVIAPLDHTMNYLAKTVTRGTQEYYYTVPDDPRQKFLGNAGDDVFWSPNIIAPGSKQLWIGFGADVAIPVENFRNESFTLDLVGFLGPGEMNLFTSTLDPDFMLENPVLRMLSSHEPGLRSTWIKPGLHTHNHTTFSQPGRYKVTYRASARTKDGQLIASAPQSVYWQVGGASAAEGIPETVPTRYNAVAATTAHSDAFHPVFRVAPSTQPNGPKLTELSFNTGNPADSGTAVFYVNGYFLTEIPVNGGVAKWTELIGAKDANLQVVYIPSQSSQSPRWVSEVISYAQGDLDDSTSRTGTFPVPNKDETLPAFNFSDRVVTNPEVTLTLNANQSGYQVTAVPAQDDLPLRVTGGFYRNLDDKHPSCEVDFISYPQERSFSFSTDDCYHVNYFKLSVVPDSLNPLGAFTHTGQVTENSGQQTHVLKLASVPYIPQDNLPHNSDSSEGAIPGDPAGPGSSTAPGAGGNNETPKNTGGFEDSQESGASTPDVGAGATPGAEAGNLKMNPPAAVETKPVSISEGHLDIGPRFFGPQLKVVLKDDSRQHGEDSILREPQAVHILVPETAHTRRSKRVFGDSSFDFLGAHNTHLYVLGATQQAGRPWPGFSTEDFDYARFPQGVNLVLTPLDAPQGAKWWGFTSAPLGGLGQIIFDSSTPMVLKNPQRTHMHLNWAFTSAGVYKLKIRAVVPSTDRTSFRPATTDPITSEETTVTFLVISPTDEPAPNSEPSRDSVKNPNQADQPAADQGPASQEPNRLTPDQVTPSGKQPKPIVKSGNGLRLPTTGSQTLLLFSFSILALGAGTLALALRRR